MRRDWEVTRQILAEIEEHDRISPPPPDSDEHPVWLHQIILLIDDKLVRGYEVEDMYYESNGGLTSLRATAPHPRLTSKGHDVLDSIRDNEIWDQTRNTISKVGGGVAVSVLIAVASQFVKEKLGLTSK